MEIEKTAKEIMDEEGFAMVWTAVKSKWETMVTEDLHKAIFPQEVARWRKILL